MQKRIRQVEWSYIHLVSQYTGDDDEQEFERFLISVCCTPRLNKRIIAIDIASAAAKTFSAKVAWADRGFLR